MHAWALDSGYTPQIAVNATVSGVQVPHAYVRDGQIVLNVHPQAVEQLEIGNETISFFARFGGKSEPVLIPVSAVLAIFARENGHGIQFPPDEDGAEPPPTPEPSSPKKGVHLKIVK
jgi:stringent starvation protein B